ncbi:MAG: hypothetical protein AAF480_00725 [Actinomycetota bacterium]
MTPGDESVAVDGRTARRDRNRRAVLNAIIDLIQEGNPLPTVAEISERSGTSHRSLFRYFDDLDSLFAEAVLVAYGRYAPLSRIHRFGHGTRSERIDNLIAQRLALYDAMAPLVHSGRRRRGAMEPMELAMAQYMGPMRDQLAAHFGPEVEACPVGERGALLDAVEALLSIEGFEFLRRNQRSDEEIAAAYRAGLHRLLR